MPICPQPSEGLDHVQRMRAELADLTAKTERLATFAVHTNDVFAALDNEDRQLLLAQLGAMQTYRALLLIRLARA